jgi:hypothetical protein
MHYGTERNPNPICGCVKDHLWFPKTGEMTTWDEMKRIMVARAEAV